MTTKPLAAWLESWPWTKTLVAAGVVGFSLTLNVGMVGVLLIVIVPALRVIGAENLALLTEARAWFNDALQWSIVAATGGVLGLGLKRAATKPEVVTAEADASVKIIKATAAAVPPLTSAEATAAAKVPTADQETAGDEQPEPVAARPIPGGGES